MLRAAIIGLGNWGRHLVSSVQGKSEKIRFVCCVAPTDAQPAYLAREGLRLYPDYPSALADPEVDAVVVATTNSQHVGHAIQAAEAGKHVFVEKPVALTRGSAAEMLDVCAARKVTLAAGFNWRCHPAVRDLRRMVEQGALGTLLHVEGNYSGPSGYRRPPGHWRSSATENPAGGMASRGIHIADLMIAMFGEIERLTASSVRRALERDIDDTTSALLNFRNGMTGYLATMMATAELWRLHVFGAKGWAELRFIEHLPRFELASCTIDGPLEVHGYPAVNIEHAELEAFADAVRSALPCVVPRREVLHGVAVFEAIAASAARDNSWLRID